MSDDAIQRYEQMLAEDPKSRAFAPLAEAHRKAGRLDEAIKVAKTGLEVHPGYSGGLVVLGRALYEKGELDNAVEVLQKAVHDTPESYLGQKFLGKVLIDKGESKGALRALESANLLSPEDEEVSRLLDDMKSKATPPETMEYKERAVGSAANAQIVTYEQKPTTVDGIELSPLPIDETDDKFSFSGGGNVNPSDIIPIPVKEEAAPVAPPIPMEEIAPEEVAPVETVISEATAAGTAEEDVTATVIEEEEVEQAMQIESLDELGPEAAAFIQEGEDLVAATVEDLPDDGSIAAGEFMEEVVVEVEEIPSPSADPPGAAAATEVSGAQIQSTPESVPTPAPASSVAEASPSAETMGDMTEDKPAPEPEPASESVPEPEPEPQFAAESPSQNVAREEPFSTETLADLYAQQGLVEKATNIYRQILDQTPANETVKLKLDALEAPAPHDTETLQEVQRPEEAQPESLQLNDNEDTLSVLEGLLENVERINKP